MNQLLQKIGHKSELSKEIWSRIQSRMKHGMIGNPGDKKHLHTKRSTSSNHKQIWWITYLYPVPLTSNNNSYHVKSDAIFQMIKHWWAYIICWHWKIPRSRELLNIKVDFTRHDSWLHMTWYKDGVRCQWIVH